MEKNTARRLVLAALLAALCCVGTMVLQFPLPGSGYANLGDCFVVLSGLLLGPAWGAAAGGIGTALADLISGYGIYAPATLVIKAAMAAAAYGVFRALRKRTWSAIIAAAAAACIMAGGYFLFELALYGFGTALADIPGNAVQGGVSIVLTAVIYPVASLALKRAEK